MRKITEAASNAFKAGRNFSSGNTTVTFESEEIRMYLHGNLIAWRAHDTLDRVNVSLAGWGTPTTRERVNGLLTVMGSRAGYYQRDYGQRFCDANGDRDVDPSEWIEVRIN